MYLSSSLLFEFLNKSWERQSTSGAEGGQAADIADIDVFFASPSSQAEQFRPS